MTTKIHILNPHNSATTVCRREANDTAMSLSAIVEQLYDDAVCATCRNTAIELDLFSQKVKETSQ